METEKGRGKISGWPIPEPKVYKTSHGDVTVPNRTPSKQVLAAQPSHGWTGAPLVPTGNPMLDGVGPGAWTERADRPDETYEGLPKVTPMRSTPGYGIVKGDTDPRGLQVVGADGVSGGKVVDLWVDTAENLFRYLEIEVKGTGRRVLVPMNFARISRREVKVQAVTGSQFAVVPGTQARPRS